MIFYENPLKIEFADEGLLVEGVKKEYSVRMLSELSDVLQKPHYKEDKPIYLMYREVFVRDSIRYDITIIASRLLGDEYARTYGHYHPVSEDDMIYPEVYQVLFGDAKFILQKINEDASVNVIIVTAKEGDILLIPPGYGHISINTNEKEPLFLSNLVSDKFKSSYEEYKKNKGPAVFYTRNGVEQNTNYIVKNLEKMDADKLNKNYGFVSKDLLKEFYETPKKFEFLNKPSLLFK